MVRVLIADDQKLMRDSLYILLDRTADIDVVGQAGDGREAVALAGQLRPDVILMDVNMPRMDGIEATRQIAERQKQVSILMVSLSVDETSVRTAMENGARGYLSKGDAFEELIPAIDAVQEQRLFFSKAIRVQCPNAVIGYMAAGEEKRSAKNPRPNWAHLRDRYQGTMQYAKQTMNVARDVCQHSVTVRSASSRTRENSRPLRQLRHPDVVVAP